MNPVMHEQTLPTVNYSDMAALSLRRRKERGIVAEASAFWFQLRSEFDQRPHP